jgi:NitT/TauT family transport system substrate-binding protein
MKAREDGWMQKARSRRRFISGLSVTAAAALLPRPIAAAAEERLETTQIRLSRVGGAVCAAPQYIADELLRAEGFTDIRFVDTAPGAPVIAAMGRGEFDFGLNYVAPDILSVEAGEPITMLAGIHFGCFELFGNDRVRSTTDLKGKKVAVPALGSPAHAFLSVMAANVGVDPGKDIHWITGTSPNAIELFARGEVDAILGFAPGTFELRERRIGHVVVDSSVDAPWSQYFCCILCGNRNFVREKPVATKRVLRAILKAADLCSTDPARAAQRLVDGGFTSRYDYALETLKQLPYDKWRDYDPNDTLRFYAVRLHEAGMIKSTPQKIIADATDWRFLNELKRELKA